MGSRIKFFLLYYIYWLCIFFLAKLVFLLYHINLTATLSVSDIAGIFIHGFMLDLSASSYLVLFPLLVLLFTVYAGGKLTSRIIGTYTLIALIPLVIAILVDLEIYKYWGIRLDNTALRFLGKPREMLASTSWGMIVILVASLVVFVFLLFNAYQKLIAIHLVQSEKPRWKGIPVFLLVFPLLFVAIRGGTGIAAISVSRVYFHPDPYPNHAAINVLWNTMHSLLEKKDQPNPFRFQDDKANHEGLSALYAETNPGTRLLNHNKPNIILVVLESFTAKLVEPLGGLPGVTPQFNRLCNEGVLFSNYFASDSRTDKSLVSILSGYPALGKISIIKFPNKTQKLGIISRDLAQAGYQTSFMYGGDVDFANIRSYLVNGRFQEIIEITDFNKSLRTGRWGVHDQHTFNRLIEECNQETRPFFKVLLTLSHHEPFDVPIPPKFGRSTIDTKVSSSAYYVDSCIGDFIQKAKQSSWWKNTLIIFQADHGSKFPGNTIVYYPEKYRIPMVWTGGAIIKDTVITTYMAQADLASSLLHQLQIPAEQYPLSRNIFRSTHQFAFYEFNNGFGFMSDSVKFVYDNDLEKVILNKGAITDSLIQKGKAIQQEAYEIFLKN
ncbi:MAG: sulfatase-like hydrolase/transferase [Bacteroidales bacterium]|nr:sulfatase-like hydrolase/transferase [Bacteroidales bacterium]